MLHWRGFTDLTYKDYEPLVLTNRDAAALFVSQEAPWQNLRELADYLREHPGKLTGSGTAKGGIWHLALAGGLKALGLPTNAVIWVPSNGAGPSLQELASGGFDMVCCSLPEAQSLLDAKKVRPLGVMAEERVPQYPDVPTFREQGADWIMGGWRGFALPLGVSPEIVTRLREAICRAVQSEDYLSFMRARGFESCCVPGEQFRRALAQNDEALGVLMREQFANLVPDRFGPMFFPRCIGVAMLVIAGILILQWLTAPTQARLQPELAANEPSVSRAGLVRLLESIGAVVVFVWLVEPLGFLLAAALMLGYLLLRLGAGWRVSVIVVPSTGSRDLRAFRPAVSRAFASRYSGLVGDECGAGYPHRDRAGLASDDLGRNLLLGGVRSVHRLDPWPDRDHGRRPAGAAHVLPGPRCRFVGHRHPGGVRHLCRGHSQHAGADSRHAFLGGLH